jgi:phage terminase large subunit-like protein
VSALGDIDRVAFADRIAVIKQASDLLEGPSLAARLARVPAELRAKALGELGGIDWTRLLYDWRFWARPKQLPPDGDWDTWLLLAGRGFGKSRTGAEWIVDGILRGECESAILIGPTFEDTRKYMVGGYKGRAKNGSGILDVAPPWLIPDPVEAHKQTKHEIHCANGAVIYYTSAEKPELRGANLGRAWFDELCVCPAADILWDNLMLTMREKGGHPRTLVTTTPRPMDLLRDIAMDVGTVTVVGSTVENRENVHEKWLERIQRRLGGTRLGRQELEAEILGDNPDALFTMTAIELARVRESPQLVAIVVAVDPAISTRHYSDATGIVVVGLGRDGDLYVLADMTGRHKPEEWGALVAKALLAWKADLVVERNRGGDLVSANVRAALSQLANPQQHRPKFHEVDAFGEKSIRAQPLSTLYEQGRVHHVGRLPRLEGEMTEWDPRTGKSPNGLDALVHAANNLSPDLTGKGRIRDAYTGLRHVQARLVAASRPAGRSMVGSILPRNTGRSSRF